jgi:adenine-specific DNA-methyltransferase
MPRLDWIGRKAVENHHRQVPFHLLKEVPELSVGDLDSGNASPQLSTGLLVEGDNLLALKALIPYYAGQVKCIYIDPPYNTGNENWIYNDNVNSPEMKNWLNKAVGREGEDLTRHDKWLSMMYPRLLLLWKMLRDEGAIFVSIDDNEIHFLRAIMDEIFGPANFVACILWQKKYAASNDHKSIAPMHDYILVYRKTAKFQRNLLPRTAEKDRQYRFEDDQGIFRISDYTCNKNADERPNLYYSITNPNTGVVIYPKRTRVWGYSPDLFQQHVEQNLIWWGKDGQAKVPAFKRYKHRLKGGGSTVL